MKLQLSPSWVTAWSAAAWVIISVRGMSNAPTSLEQLRSTPTESLVQPNRSAQFLQTRVAQDVQAFPCYFINLKKRPDRRIQMEQEMYHAGLKCERIEAVDAVENGILPPEACRQSHLLALDRLKMSGKPYGLILEDDATFLDLKAAKPILHQLPEAMANHPVVVLACSHGAGKPGSGIPTDVGWLQAVGQTACLTTSAYFIRLDYVDVLESQAYNRVIKKIHWGDIDQRWLKLQSRDHWAMTYPLLIKQRKTFSDIENKMVDYGVLASRRPAAMTKTVALLARRQDPVAQQLITAAEAHAEAASAIKEAASALKDTALSLKTTVAQVAEASGEEDKLKKAVKAHIDQSSEELEKLEKSLVPAKVLREMVEAQGPPTTPAPPAPVVVPPPPPVAAPIVAAAAPAPAAPLPTLVMPPPAPMVVAAAPAAPEIVAVAGAPAAPAAA